MLKGRGLRGLLAAVLIAGATTSDAVAASPFAAPARGARELTSQTTSQSRTWLLPNGRQVTQIAAGPVQWKDRRGSWQPYDFGLDAVQGGWSGRAGAAAVTLPGSFGTTGGEPAELTLPSGVTLRTWFAGSAARAGSESGDAATYAGVASGVNIAASANAAGISEQIVLGEGVAARPLTQRFALDVAGATATVGRRGGIAFAAGGRTLFHVPAPTFADASGATAPRSGFTLRTVEPGVWEATVAADARWAAAARATPVVATLSIAQPDDFDAPPTEQCQITSANLVGSSYTASCIPTATYQTAKIGVEYTQTASMFADRFLDHMPLMRFDTLSLVPTDRVLSASLRLYRTASWRADPFPIEVYLSRRPWTQSTLTTPEAARATLGGLELPAVAKFPARGDVGYTSVDLTDTVTQWQRYAQTRGAQGRPNYGFGLVNGDSWDPDYTSESGCYYWNFSCDLATIASSANSDAALRPVLQVTTLPAAPAGSAVITPEEGELTGRRVQLQARSIRSSVGSVRYQYIAGSQRTWTDIPLAALRTTEGAPLSSQDVPVTGPTGDRRTTMVVWDVSAMPGGEVDGAVHVRAFLDSSVLGDGGFTGEISFRLDRRGIDGSASESVGPGELNLLSGELTIDEQDVGISAFLQDLKLTRTYRSRGVSRRTSDLFGPQWEASVEADGGELPYKGIYNFTEIDEDVVERQEINPEAWNWELFAETFAFEDLGAEVETFRDITRWEYRYAAVENSDGTRFTFKQTVNPDGTVTGWEPDDTHPGYRLTKTDGSNGINTMVINDPSGAVATFQSEASGSPNYRLTAFRQAGSTTALSYEYQAVGTRQRLVRVTAPLPTGGRARSLRFNWSTIGVSDVPGTTSVSRVTSIEFSDSNSTQTVAQYSYDTKGRLTRASDPRYGGTGLPTEYVYDDNRLVELRPAGEEEWRFAYTTDLAGDSGPRLASVSRDRPDGSTATENVRYDVPVSGVGAPYELSLNATRRWGQIDDLPWDAVAIYPADVVPDARSPRYEDATIYYLGLQGRVVNLATPGGHIATTEHDGNGNVIRELSATNRARALAAGANSAAVAQTLSTRNSYAPNGVDLVATFEPESNFKLSDGTFVNGRRVTTTHYDQGAPSGADHHLPTSVWRAVELSSGSRVDERELLRNSYADGGWAARQATTTIVDPNGRAITTRQYLHPSYPIVEESRTPGGSGGAAGADVQFHVYYGITPSSRVPSALASAGCAGYVGALYPSGFLCLRSEATMPDAQVQRRWYDYGTLGMATDVYEPKGLSWSSTGYRRTTTSYDTAGRVTSVAVAGGTGTAVPSSLFGYSATTGRQIEVRASGRGTITRTYDSNGRLAQYVDAAGTSSTYSYDARGRLAGRSVSGGRTTTFGYDGRDNPVAITDSTVGDTIRATFGPDGEQLTETLPNGLVGSWTYDAAGRTQKLLWEDTSDCVSSCVWVKSEVTARDPDGNIAAQQSTESHQTYTYDSAQRLTGVDDIRIAADICTRRRYAYDIESNRTSRSDQVATRWAACGVGTTATRSWGYDQADRITNSGWVYDSFGRATSVPAGDSGGSGALTSAYYVNNMVRQMTLDGRTHVYDRDPLDRTSVTTSSGASKPSVTSTNRYADDGDSPIAVSRSDGSTSDLVTGPGGRLVATREGSTLTYSLRDIHGSVVAVASSDASARTPVKRTETDEFGIVVQASAAVIDDSRGVPGYGWLGGAQRTTEFGRAPGSGGPMQMGVRVYLPTVGRFLQTDPVDGGSANAYDYAFQNPVNIQDLDGRCPLCGLALVVGSRMAIQQAARIVGTNAARQVVVRAGAGAAAKKVAARNARFARVNKFQLKSTSKHLLERMKGSRGDGGVAPWAVNHALHHGSGTCTGPGVYTFTSRYATVLVNSNTGKIFNAIPANSRSYWGQPAP